MAYLVVLGGNFEKLLSYLKKRPKICSIATLGAKIKSVILGIFKMLNLGIFGLELKIILSYL